MSDAGPPKDIPPSELWTRLASAKRAFEIVDFPRKDPVTGEPVGKIAIWVLTQGEIIAAQAEATRYARAVIREKFDAVERIEGYAEVYENASACEMIFRFCRRPDNPDWPVFPTAASVRQKLTSDECAVLINAYSLVQVKLGPIAAAMTPADYEAWVKRLQEGGSAAPLASLSLGQRTGLLMYSVDQLVSLRTGNSSPGKPLDEVTLSESID